MTGALPSSFPEGTNVGVLIALACSGRLITPELVLAMSCQTPATHLSSGFYLVKGKPVEEAREMCAQQALAVNAKYLWFIDDDTIPPPNTLRRLIYILENNPDIMVCGGVYATKSDPPAPVVFRGMGLGSFWEWKKGDVFEVTGMGAGCMMIKTEIFKKIPAPYFPWPKFESVDPTIPSTSVSEDISFCNAVRKAGYKVFAHGDILCDHFDVTTGETFRLRADSFPMRPISEAQEASDLTKKDN